MLSKEFIKNPVLFLTYLFEAQSYARQGNLSMVDHHKFMLSPYLNDRTETLEIEPHYTYHTAWAARRIAEINPQKHVDISSHRFFATLVSAFVPMEYYEYRPVELYLKGLTAGKADILSLPFADNSIKSLSCMHVIEHLGLGRYGDPIDAMADKKAAKELTRVLSGGADLLIVVPVGKRTQVQFNNQRIYRYDDVINMFLGLKLVEFSLVPDDWHKGMVKNASPDLTNKQNYGCGCFWFKKSM